MRFWGEFFVVTLVLALLVACGDDGSSGGEPDSLSEKGTVSGYVQKGPFSKGSDIEVQELEMLSLVPTGEIAEGKVSNDSGAYSVDCHFEFPYALIKAEGTFRNELTGKKTKSPITLYAMADLSDRSETNVNLLTHLAYQRIHYLVSMEGYGFKKARNSAEREVLAAFGVLDSLPAAGDLNIYGSEAGDTALLAMSVLVLGGLEGGVGGLSISTGNDRENDDAFRLERRLTDIADDIEEDGVWDDRSAIAKIADWAADQSISGKLDSSYKAIAKIVNRFWWNAYGLTECNEKNELLELQNSNSLSQRRGVYFVCQDKNWRVKDGQDIADTIDVDTLGVDTSTVEIDTLEHGPADTTQVKDTTQVTDTTGVADTTGIADTSTVDTVELSELEKDTQGQKCVSFGQIVHGAVDTNKVYFCDGVAWKLFEGNENTTYYRLVDGRDGQIYRTVRIGTQYWMAENLNYGGDTAYTWTEAREACPAGWHLSNREEWEKMFSTVNDVSAFVLDEYGFATIPSGQLKADYWTASFDKDTQGKHPYSIEFTRASTSLSKLYDATSRLPVRCVQDYDVYLGGCNEENLYTTAIHNYVMYIVCTENGWEQMCADDYNEFKWTIVAEGRRMWDGANPRRCYVYESGAWHERDSSNCRLNIGACTAARDSEIVTMSSGARYRCENFAWRRLSHVDVDLMQLEGETAEEGSIRSMDCVLEHIYVFQDGKWRLGTKLDSILVSLGGTACLNVGDISEVKYDGKYYKCMENVDNEVAQEWVAMPSLYNETHDDIGECSATGLYGDGRLHNKLDQAAHIYACDDGDFRRTTKAERLLNLGCVSYNRGTKIKVNLSQFVCGEEGWELDRSVGNGVLADPRDGREYRTVDIWKQTWMAENMTYTDAAELTSLRGRVWCYGNDPEKCNTYGALYGCAAARAVCPEGWHLPTLADWDSLIVFIQDMGMVRGHVLRSTTGWVDLDGENKNGTDKLGFTILPGGYKKGDDLFDGENNETWFWYDNGCEEDVRRYGFYFDYTGSAFFTSNDDAEAGYYVRCVKD